MKKALLAALAFLVAFPCFSAGAAAEESADIKNFVRGGFEMNIFLDAVTGFQRFSNDPVTEVAYDGSNAGVLGEYPPAPPCCGSPHPVRG